MSYQVLCSNVEGKRIPQRLAFRPSNRSKLVEGSRQASLISFAIAVAKGISNKLSSQGYDTIAPGQSHRYGKMSLSLWQQGTCVRTYIVNERTVRTETVYMRPIFSGATDKSELKHEIQFWLNKFGTENTDVTAQNNGRSLEDAMESGGNIDAQTFNGTVE